MSSYDSQQWLCEQRGLKKPHEEMICLPPYQKSVLMSCFWNAIEATTEHVTFAIRLLLGLGNVTCIWVNESSEGFSNESFLGML